MHTYEILLRNEKKRTYLIISWLLLIANFISILILTISFRFTKWGALINSLLALACVFVPSYFQKKNERIIYNGPFFFPFFFFGEAWFLSPYTWLGYTNWLFVVLSTIALRKLFVRTDKNCVVYPSIIVKRVLWKDISNLILKDGILTIDFKNNKLFQQVIDETAASVNEKEFNDFCSQQLATSNR